jgi:MFS family permease
MVGGNGARVVGGTRFWRWIVAALAATQAVAPLIAGALAPDFLRGEPGDEATITPAGYAFAIWGLICLLSLATAVVLLRFPLGTPWERRALGDLAVVFVGFSAWLYAAAQDWLWVTVVVFAAMFAALVDVMRLLVRDAVAPRCPRWVAVLATTTFGLYLGWTSVAVFVNLAAALITGGWSGAGYFGTAWQLVLLVAAAATAIVLTRLLRATAGYVAGVLWALVAAAIGAVGRGAPVLAAAVVVASVAVGAAAVAIRRDSQASR